MFPNSRFCLFSCAALVIYEIPERPSPAPMSPILISSPLEVAVIMATTPRKLNAEEASKVKEQMASDFAMEVQSVDVWLPWLSFSSIPSHFFPFKMSGANWKLWQWALYVPFAIFPILLAITIQVEILDVQSLLGENPFLPLIQFFF